MGAKEQLIVDEVGKRINLNIDDLIIGLKGFQYKLKWKIAGANDDYMCDTDARVEIQINVLKSIQDLVDLVCKEYKEEMEQ